MSAFEFRAPGKLFVAGEYGVVRAGNPAVLIAVDRVVTARVSPVRRAFGVRVASEQWGEERDYAPVIAEAPASEQPREPIFRALDVFVEYYGPLPALDIHVSSTLDDSDGRKYGFGSSGAVVVATIGATARALNIALSPRELFKLSALAVLDGNVRASCADVATSVLGGWVLYRSFDREAVCDLRAREGVKSALAAQWPGLALESLDVPHALKTVIGWSGAPASTRSLVAQVDDAAGAGRIDFEAFARENAAHVERFVEAVRTGSTIDAMRVLECVLAQLRDLDAAAGGSEGPLGIETPELRAMTEIAVAHGAAAKLSGAGGGDCVLALAPNADVATAVRQAWRRAGMIALNVGVEPSDLHARTHVTTEKQGSAHE